MRDASGGADRGLNRSDLSMAEFNELLSFTPEHAKPTTHALIIRDDNELLIYGKRSRNTDSEWTVRSFRVVGPNVRFQVTDRDRADLAAVIVEEFEGEELTTDEKYANRRPVPYGVPSAVAVDGRPAVAAWLYVRGETRDDLADVMDVTERSVGEYLSRFRRRGIGLPDDVDVPAVGETVQTVPAQFDPDGHQIVAADGGATPDA